jgi:uncharacterized protein (DUF983 family)
MMAIFIAIFILIWSAYELADYIDDRYWVDFDIIFPIIILVEIAALMQIVYSLLTN